MAEGVALEVDHRVHVPLRERKREYVCQHVCVCARVRPFLPHSSLRKDFLDNAAVDTRQGGASG